MLALRINRINGDWDPYWKALAQQNSAAASDNSPQKSLRHTAVAGAPVIDFIGNERAAKAKGVKRVCVPNRSTKSPARRREQKKRWFRQGQKWRTGCEGRISAVKRRSGLRAAPE
jgi:hypothetical protein